MNGDVRTTLKLIPTTWPLLAALALCCLCAALPARADTAAIDARSSGASMNPQLELYIDRSDTMTLEQVVATDRFVPSHGVAGLGLLPHPVWLRLRMAPAAGAPSRWRLEIKPTSVDDLRYYAPDGKGGFSMIQSGERFPFASRGLQFRKFVYPVELPAGQTTTVYFRLLETTAVVFPLKIWQMDDWAAQAMLDYLLLGCCIGVMAGLACYNMMLFVRIRDPLFLLYFVAILSYLMFVANMTGIGAQVLWPNAGYRVPHLTEIIAAFTSAAVSLFGQMMVRGGRIGRWFDWIMAVVVLIFLSAALSAALGDVTYAAFVVTKLPLLLIPAMMIVVLYRAFTGFRPAVYYLIGYGPVLYGVMLLLKVGTGEAPATRFNESFYIIAGAWEAVLFSQALAVRFTLLRHEKDRVQAGILEAQSLRLADARTHAAQLEAKVRERTAQLEDANQIKSLFLANMSHEIRNPMNAVIGFSRLGLQSALDGATRSYLQKILGAAENLLGILNDVLDFSKIEAGKMELEVVPFEIEHILEQLCDLIVLSTDAKGVETIVRIGPGVPERLLGDALRLRQVLSNLASNAAKFTERGEVAIAVALIERDDTSAQLEFSVRDTGIGMTPAQMEYLFQSFSQADASTTRKYGGTGLGLAISKQLVELMGGTIDVGSQPGIGSRFSFRLRLALPQDAAPAVHAPLPAQRVLVVDDNAQAREVLAELLAGFGMQVASVADGKHALAALIEAEARGEPVELVLIDWGMAGWDGIETARRIRLDARLRMLRTVLMVSAYGREEAVRLGATSYVDGFLAKPAGATLLRQCLLHAADSHTAQHLPAAPHVPAREMGLAGARILLVEDSQLNREVALGLLDRSGIIVDVAEDGRQAVAMTAAGDYDLVFMDIQMPVMDGLTASRAIRALPGKAALPIVAMTAHGMSGDQAASLAAGMNDHIVKPIHPERLFDALDRWIDRAALAGRVPAPSPHEGSETGAGRPALPPSDSFDLDAARAMLGDSDELLLSTLQIFIDENRGAARAVGAALAARQFSAIAAVAHTVKSAAGYLCAGTLARSAATLEQLARQPRSDAIVLAAQVLHFQSDLAQALQAAAALLPALQELASATAADGVEDAP